MWFLLYYLLHLLSSDHFTALTSLQPYKFFIWTYELFRNHPWKIAFFNVNLSNLENVLLRNLRADRAWECILEYLHAQILKIYPFYANHVGTFVGSMCVWACPKTLWIHYWEVTSNYTIISSFSMKTFLMQLENVVKFLLLLFSTFT